MLIDTRRQIIDTVLNMSVCKGLVMRLSLSPNNEITLLLLIAFSHTRKEYSLKRSI